jgi:uncharacterized protein YbjT (DUF2867 family)
MTYRILVTGATGTVGGHLVDELRGRGAALRVATRDPARTAVRWPDTETVEFDFERPATFDPALAGVEAVFLIARPGDDESDRVAFPLIERMRVAGVRRVVDLSAMGAERRDDFALRRIERKLEDDGFAFTHLRPNFFLQVFSTGPLLAQIRATGALQLPAADARLSYVDARDVAAVAAAALSSAGHEHRAYTLTGGEALEHAEVARAISLACDRPVRYEPLEEDAARNQLAAAGLSPARIERLIGFYRLVRAGACAPVHPDVAEVLGRPPLTLERFARDHRAAWT